MICIQQCIVAYKQLKCAGINIESLWCIRSVLSLPLQYGTQCDSVKLYHLYYEYRCIITIGIILFSDEAHDMNQVCFT